MGHQVTLLGDGDAFKKYPVDIDSAPGRFSTSHPIAVFFRKLWFYVFKIDPIQWEYGRRFFRMKKHLKDFDVVQLINENAIKTTPRLEKKAVRFLRKNNEKLFLLSCGEDYYSVSHMLKHRNSYSVLTPYFKNKKLKKQFHYTLKYVSKPYKKLSTFIREHVDGIIASDIEYHIPLLHTKKYKGMIPNPVNVDKIQFQTLPVKDKIRIFHGINTWNYTKKGNHYFEAALQRIVEKYPGSVAVKTARSVPYNTYITMYNDYHIVLDQVYSYDQGYNALEAMAKGKVVFTGAEAAFTQHYKLTQPVVVNALPDVDYLVEKLSFFIENPQEITVMGKNARAFIEHHHHYINVAGQYLKTWMDNSFEGV